MISLNQYVIFGKPTIDLFASNLNNKVPHNCAWEPDPGAVFIDSLMYDWNEEKLVYAFPTFRVIHMVVRKLTPDKAKAIAVVPFWPTQPWFVTCKYSVWGTHRYRCR